ncbi:MAG: alkaline phosphatase family protein [Actinomycetes bacterium]
MSRPRGLLPHPSVSALATVAALLAAGLAPLTAVTASAAAAAGPCGTLPYPGHLPTYQHVVVIMDENLGYDDFQKATDAPYLHALQSACGAETNMHAATHPSRPNYMAATSGVASKQGVHTAANNVFHQVQAHGGTWRVYAESMPKPCSASTTAAPLYKTGHNPAFWYTDLRSPKNSCVAADLPLKALRADLAADRLPSYAWVVCDVCGDMHWAPACPFPQTGRVAAGDPDCRIATIVVSPYVVPGAKDSSDQNLYSLLTTTEDVLGLARLGRAVGQRSMRAGLHF